MARGLLTLAILALLPCVIALQATNTSAVYALLERLYPAQTPHFTFTLQPPDALCGTLSPPCFTLSSDTPGQVNISASSVSELTGGLGYYLREYANQTIGWPFGGSSFTFIPSPWPSVGPQPFSARRAVPWTWFQNVCTHSYTLGFYSFAEWSQYLDWQALSGINIFYGYTGQEEMQYKVFIALGLNDTTIRSWFNGPAFLTWSRGQNSHGGAIAGPLPRSWMKAQWDLQQQILARARSLGQVPALPGFQGNVPWPLAAALGDTTITFMNSTVPGSTATGWMNATDPFFAKVGDLWMATLLKDFGTDHVYAMDGFFHDGTGWGVEQGKGGEGSSGSQGVAKSPFSSASSPPLSTCEFGPPLMNTYLDGCASEAPPCPTFPTLTAAQAACAASPLCTGGVTQEGGSYQLRAGRTPMASPKHETSWLLLDTTSPPCHGPDPQWLARGRAAYGVLSRADPKAVWLWQGWALMVGGMTLSQLQGFSLAPPDPEHQFLVLDMSRDGEGQWEGYGGGVTPFIQTSLHTFGGNDALKGNISLVATMLDKALTTSPPPKVLGVGATPEGFDQNPVYYEAIFQSAWRSSSNGTSRSSTSPPSGSNVGEWLRARAHRRYGTFMQGPQADPVCLAAIDAAWDGLGAGIYAFDQGVQDSTGVGLTEAQPSPLFWGSGGGGGGGKSSRVPTPLLCSIWRAWGELVDAAPCVAPQPLPPPLTTTTNTTTTNTTPSSPYVYDLVNTGREVLAQMASLYAGQFGEARRGIPLNASVVNSTGGAYRGLLLDLDTLLGTSLDFLLGPRLEQARGWGGGGVEDCGGSVIHPGTSCSAFYEWNLRVQLTTWYPTASPNASTVPPRDGDYARKHWSGLVKDYYAARVGEYTQQALQDAGKGVPYDVVAAQRREAQLAWQWTTSTNAYPTDPVGDAVAVSNTLRQKYGGVFQGC